MKLLSKSLVFIVVVGMIVLGALYPGGKVSASTIMDIPPGYGGVDCPEEPIQAPGELDPDWAQMCAECLNNTSLEPTETSWVNPGYTPIPTWDGGGFSTEIAQTQQAYEATHTQDSIWATVTALAGTPTQVLTPTITSTPTQTTTPTITPTSTPAGYKVFEWTSIYYDVEAHYFSSTGWFFHPWNFGTPSESAGICVAAQKTGGVQGGWHYLESSTNWQLSKFWITDAAYNAINTGLSNKISIANITAECGVGSITYLGGNSPLWITNPTHYFVMNAYGGQTQTIAVWVKWLIDMTSITPTPAPTMTATQTITPTVTATSTLIPFPTSTQGSLPILDCTEPEYIDNEPIIDFDGFVYWGNECYSYFPGIELELPEVGGFPGYEVSIPNVQVCVDWYEEPDFSVLGVTIPVTYIIAAPVVAWLVRSFFRM